MKLMTIKNVADELKVSVKSVYRLINAGKLAKVKVGRVTRIPEDIFDHYQHSIGYRAVER